MNEFRKPPRKSEDRLFGPISGGDSAGDRSPRRRESADRPGDVRSIPDGAEAIEEPEPKVRDDAADRDEGFEPEPEAEGLDGGRGIRPPAAWQPLTFRGVAAFSSAPVRRLFLIQLLAAAVTAGTVLWFAHTAWEPQVEAAVGNMPDLGEIRNGSLIWPVESRLKLAENRFLSLVVDPLDRPSVGSVSDLQLEFEMSNVKLRSLFGYLAIPYPADRVFGFNQPELRAWWEAWRTTLAMGVGSVVVLFLFVFWIAQASLYCLPIRWLAFFTDRHVGVTGCWKLAAASLIPAIHFLCGGMVLYGNQWIGLVGLLLIAGGHFIVGWVYLVGASLHLSRLDESTATTGNPFEPDTRPSPRSPFGGSG